MTIEPAGVDGVIVYFSHAISKESNTLVKSSYNHLKALNHKGITQLIPSYSSLFVVYDIFIFSFDEVKIFLQSQLENLEGEKESKEELLVIDVYYGDEVGLDLKDVALEKGLSVEEVIEIHSSKIYDVYAIGFSAGFAFLGEIDQSIQSQRLKSPRKKIEGGSVAIADKQTAIYPSDSPGGWKILGKTPLSLIDKKSKDLSIINFSTKIKFNPITKEEFLFRGGKI